MGWEDHSEETWSVFDSKACGELVRRSAPPPDGPPPAYCSLWGVRCCTPQLRAAGGCRGPYGSVTNITIKADSVNGSVSDPRILGAFEELHACGLEGLNLESNDISGSLTGPWWARMTNLTVLDLGARAAAAAAGVGCRARLGTRPCLARRARQRGALAIPAACPPLTAPNLATPPLRPRPAANNWLTGGPLTLQLRPAARPPSAAVLPAAAAQPAAPSHLPLPAHPSPSIAAPTMQARSPLSSAS
jgi:hypothetical protein